MTRTGGSYKLLITVSTLGPVGYLPIAPGTWGSGVATVVWWSAFSFFSVPVQWMVIAAVAGLAVWCSGIAEKSLGHDAKPIVIDEVAGQWITLIAAQHNMFLIITGFFLFRLMDIWKPFPANLSQKLPGGWGVVADDVIAGGYAAVVLLIVNRVFM